MLRGDLDDLTPVGRPDAADVFGADLGRYWLLGEIAHGGMGVSFDRAPILVGIASRALTAPALATLSALSRLLFLLLVAIPGWVLARRA